MIGSGTLGQRWGRGGILSVPAVLLQPQDAGGWVDPGQMEPAWQFTVPGFWQLRPPVTLRVLSPHYRRLGGSDCTELSITILSKDFVIFEVSG